jgi:hypothetical protein
MRDGSQAPIQGLGAYGSARVQSACGLISAPASREPAYWLRQQCSRWESALPLTRRPLRVLAVVRCPASPHWRPGAGMACLRASARGTPAPGTA